MRPELTYTQARSAAREIYAEHFNCDPPRVEGLRVEYDDSDDTWTWSGVFVDEKYGEVEFWMFDHDTEGLTVGW